MRYLHIHPPYPVFLDQVLAQAYADARAVHGQLALTPQDFSAHVWRVVAKRFNGRVDAEAAVRFVQSLHRTDLYLAAACAHGSEAAWERLLALYCRQMEKDAEAFCPTAYQARDLADSMPGHLFSPDRSGQSRIAGYDGRSALATWLSTIVYHRALNETARKDNQALPLDGLPDICDWAGLRAGEARLRAREYAPPIQRAFVGAARALAARDRRLLLWRYEEEVSVTRLAQFCGVHPATITRRLQTAQERFRAEFVRRLARECDLSAAAIEECLTDLLENPAHPVFDWLRTGMPPSA